MSTSHHRAPHHGASQASAGDRDSRVSGNTAESEGALSDAGRKRRLLSEAQEAEVREQRETLRETRRVTAPGLEEILGGTAFVLGLGIDRVAIQAAIAEITRLEISGLLIEAVEIKSVVNNIVEIE